MASSVTPPWAYLSGETLRISTRHDPPWQIRIDNEDGSVEWTGFTFEILNLISRYANFSMSVFVNKEDEYGALDPVSGKWRGILGDVEKGDADIAGSAFILDRLRTMYFRIGYPILYDSRAMIISAPPKDASSAAKEGMWSEDAIRELMDYGKAFRVYSWQTWLATAAVALAVIVLAKVLDRGMAAAHRLDKDGGAHLHGDASPASSNWFTATEMLTRFFTTQDTPALPASAPLKILTASWAFMCVVFIALYPAQLFSLLAVRPAYQPPFTNFETMLESGYELLGEKGTVIETSLRALLAEANGSAAGDALMEYMHEDRCVKHIDEIKKLLQSDGRYALYIYKSWRTDKQDEKCSLRVVDVNYPVRTADGQILEAPLPEDVYSIAYARSPAGDKLQNAIDPLLLKLWDQGKIQLIQDMMDQWRFNFATPPVPLFQEVYCTDLQTSSSSGASSMSLPQLASPFWGLLAGSLIGAAVLTGEILWKRFVGKPQSKAASAAPSAQWWMLRRLQQDADNWRTAVFGERKKSWHVTRVDPVRQWGR